MSVPFIGEIRLFPHATGQWLPCDGWLLPISEYETLFMLLANRYGGDGSTTFAVPDLRGRVPVHQGTVASGGSYRVGERKGAEQVTLMPAQMPRHSHGVKASQAAADAREAAGNVPATITGGTMYAAAQANDRQFELAGTMITPQGGGQAHDNLMPTVTLSYCIAVAGTFPRHG